MSVSSSLNTAFPPAQLRQQQILDVVDRLGSFALSAHDMSRVHVTTVAVLAIGAWLFGQFVVIAWHSCTLSLTVLWIYFINQ